MWFKPTWLALAGLAQAAAWPNGPLSTSGRWIKDASGANMTYAGVNWPGSADTMIPEGLQYQSIQAIVSKIKSVGINSIRLTFATEMVDAVFSNGRNDVSIQSAFTTALGQDNGTAVLAKVLKNNPTFTSSTSRLEVYDAIATECAKQEIYVHLDNHVSKASWCCTLFDGNAWPGDKYFSVANWTRGLAYMAEHGKKWPNLISMGLRNELRPALSSNSTLASYNFDSWYRFMKEAAAAVHTANSGVLIFLSGMDGGVTLQPVVEGKALAPGNGTFNVADFGSAADKIVLELHYYNIVGADANCSTLQANMRRNGFSALESGSSATVAMPVVLSEFGFQQDAETWKGVYASCLAEYVEEIRAGWMYWVLAGSYYVREGTQDYDEPWGLLNHDWSEWRSKADVEGRLKTLIDTTFSRVGLSASRSNSSASGSSGSGSGPSQTGGAGSGNTLSAAPRNRGGILDLWAWVASIWVLAIVSI